MRPPAAWTASVTERQPAICSGEYRPGVKTYPAADSDTWVASVMISPAEARCA